MPPPLSLPFASHTCGGISRRDALTTALATLLIQSNVVPAFAQPQPQPQPQPHSRAQPQSQAQAAPSADPSARAGSVAATPPRAVIIPLGPVSALEVSVVERALVAFYAIDVIAAARRALPRTAYYPKRGRYRAERLLSELEQHGDRSATRILGLTSVDISTTKGNVEDWGILGLASLDGRVGVLSSFRCRRGARTAAQIAHRLGKTAVHELGHTFGLEHCPSAGCLMRDGQGSVFTTDSEYDLCSTCREALRPRGLLVQSGHEPPWPRPS